jgi:hypothetical protein
MLRMQQRHTDLPILYSWPREHAVSPKPGRLLAVESMVINRNVVLRRDEASLDNCVCKGE